MIKIELFDSLYLQEKVDKKPDKKLINRVFSVLQPEIQCFIECVFPLIEKNFFSKLP